MIKASTKQPLELPWKLNPDDPAAPATRGDNTVDNVEQIFVENLPAGDYFVQVTNKGKLGGGSNVQDFSLFITSGAPDKTAAVFSIKEVITQSCETLSAGQRRVSFTPQYAGQTQEPVSFSVVNELNPTTNPGPYTLNLYTDNPRITLVAKQGSTTARYTYEWLAACPSGARLGAEPTPDLSVTVLGNPVQQGQIPVEIRGAANQPLRLNLTDMTGQIIGSHYVEQANPLERHTFEIGRQQPGLLLLRVSTPTQLKTVKLLNH